MFPDFNDVSLTVGQTLAATQLLLRVAQVDGAGSTEEVALIRQFYEAGGDAAGSLPSFDSLYSEEHKVDCAAAFSTDAQREMVVATCLMVAYADGALIAEELAEVSAIAATIGLAAPRVDELLALVKDYMLAQLAKLPDAGSVAAVARELG